MRRSLTQRREGGKDAKIDHIGLNALRLCGFALRYSGEVGGQINAEARRLKGGNATILDYDQRLPVFQARAAQPQYPEPVAVDHGRGFTFE